MVVCRGFAIGTGGIGKALLAAFGHQRRFPMQWANINGQAESERYTNNTCPSSGAQHCQAPSIAGSGDGTPTGPKDGGIRGTGALELVRAGQRRLGIALLDDGMDDEQCQSATVTMHVNARHHQGGYRSIMPLQRGGVALVHGPRALGLGLRSGPRRSETHSWQERPWPMYHGRVKGFRRIRNVAPRFGDAGVRRECPLCEMLACC